MDNVIIRATIHADNAKPRAKVRSCTQGHYCFIEVGGAMLFMTPEDVQVWIQELKDLQRRIDLAQREANQ